MEELNFYFALLLGFIAAGIGGELFIRGAIGFAKWLRVPAGIIGATVAAFATSSPELAVSINASLSGSPNIALGDALGSNIVNIGLILAVVLLIADIRVPRQSLRRDFPVALLVPILTGVLMLDGFLSRFDGFVLLGLFIVWLVAATLEARRERGEMEKETVQSNRWTAILACIFGLAFLILAGRLTVIGAKNLGTVYGIDEFIMGATIVALGTSMPELATAIISKIRGHDEIGLGTLLGSNIFNGLFIVACAAIIHPFTTEWRETAVGLIFGFLIVACTFPRRNGRLERRRGVLLLALYFVYLAVLIQFQTG